MSDHAQTRREGRLRLGFLTNVPFTSEPGGARRGLDEAIATFEYAESIGFDTGRVRQRLCPSTTVTRTTCSSGPRPTTASRWPTS